VRAAFTKTDLIRKVSAVTGITRKEGEIVTETILATIVRGLRAGDKVEVRSFGSWRTRQRGARIGRNPKTGARVEVPAKSIPYFTPSKELKDCLAEVGGPRHTKSVGHHGTEERFRGDAGLRGGQVRVDQLTEQVPNHWSARVEP
jgi:integration host factor subunit beta